MSPSSRDGSLREFIESVLLLRRPPASPHTRRLAALEYNRLGGDDP